MRGAKAAAVEIEPPGLVAEAVEAVALVSRESVAHRLGAERGRMRGALAQEDGAVRQRPHEGEGRKRDGQAHRGGREHEPAAVFRQGRLPAGPGALVEPVAPFPGRVAAPKAGIVQVRAATGRSPRR